jgi:LacI family transcriptional regulator
VQNHFAAPAFTTFASQPKKVGVLVGNYRYNCQKLNEIGFGSYFREMATEFTIL